MEEPRPKLPFAAEKDSTLFWGEAIQLLIEEFDKRRKKYAPTENFHVFQHGISWNFQRMEKDGFKPHSGELEKMTSECVIKLDQIIASDVSAIFDFIRKTADRMEEQLSQRFMSEMVTVTKETGNIFSTSKDGTVSDIFLNMIKTMPMSVDREGKVSRPTLFLSDPSFIEKLQQEVIERGPDFKNKMEEARKEQEKQALAREQDRLEKYNISE